MFECFQQCYIKANFQILSLFLEDYCVSHDTKQKSLYKLFVKTFCSLYNICPSGNEKNRLKALFISVQFTEYFLHKTTKID